MAMSPEGRRQVRNAQEKLRRRKDKREKIAFWLSLGLGIVILALAVTVLILYTDRNTAPVTEGTEPTTVADEMVAHLAFAGDLTTTENVIASGAGGFSDVFLDVTPVLAQADMSVVNFEGYIAGNGGTGAPTELLAALKKSGVDMLQMANSYSIAGGVMGMERTIDAVRENGMEALGVYRDASEYKSQKGYTVRTVKGIKIAVAAFTKGMDGMTLPDNKQNCVNLLYSDYDSTYQKVNTDKINAVLDAMDKEKPDLKIVLLHWGSEYNDTISKSQKSIMELLQKRGVNAVIGTHSHYVQSMKLSDDGKFFYAYSLGDFYGDAARAGSEYSVILDLEVTKDRATGECKIKSFSNTPIFTETVEGKPTRVVRIDAALTAEEQQYILKTENTEAMKNALERIEARINTEVK